ncbi:MAG: di-heme oxidoredictase family protein [Cypionkella sp.]
MSAACMVLWAGFALPMAAQTLNDDHLSVVPRTAAEIARIAAVTALPTDFSHPEKFEDKPGGAATVRARATSDAFSMPSANLANAEVADFNLGNGLFTKLWVSAPASTLASDGLGPLYNARGCQNCHLKDGRGHPPADANDSAVSLFLRVSIPDPAAQKSEIEGYLATLPDPVYGGQLQDFATAGQKAEYRLGIHYDEISVALAGGEVAHLRAPTYAAEDLGYGPLAPDAMLSPRMAPQMIGLGLLEAIPAADILAGVDEDDADGDGISGRANIVMSAEFGKPLLGRFGWKAGQPSVREQSAAAFSGDMGLSTSLHPDAWGDCTTAQPDCRRALDGSTGNDDGLEVSTQAMDLVTFYSQNLGVPARRNPADPQVLAGKAQFNALGCASCHTPKFVTARLTTKGAQSFQLIWPFTDLLLHDMGAGLADRRPEGRATGTEWRTPPLWGIGLTETVGGVGFYLHDGRARTLLEAILWHGGEAQTARDHVVNMPKADRAALIRYLESL